MTNLAVVKFAMIQIIRISVSLGKIGFKKPHAIEKYDICIHNLKASADRILQLIEGESE